MAGNADLDRLFSPRSVAIVEQLPKSAAGKILRRKVRDQLATDFSPEA